MREIKKPFLKICSKCRKQKWSSEFYKSKDKRQSEELRSYCKDCSGKYQQKYRQHNPKYNRSTYLKRVFGITIKEYELMLKSQNGVCAICKQTETAKQNDNILPLSVDHRHNPFKVRGLLCNNCNRALGLFNDDIEILKQAIKYLEENK